MNFEDFKESVLLELKDYYGTDAEVSINMTIKNNDTKKSGIQIKFTGDTVVPIIYIDEMYAEYDKGNLDFECVIDQIINIRENSGGTQFIDIVKDIKDYENIKEKIYPLLISKERNNELLSGLVYRDYLDLAIIYYIRLDDELNTGSATIKITKSLMEEMAITEEELFNQAIINVEKDGYKIDSILNVLMGCEDYEFNEEELLEAYSESNPKLWVITNSNKTMGSAGVLNKEIMSKLDGGYMIPSSVHEWIYINTNDDNIESFNKMVREVNTSNLSDEDILSDHVYKVDHGTLKMCA